MPTVTQVTTEARKPFYATVGLGQLAVESARTLPKTVPAEISKLQEQALTQVKTLPTVVSGLPSQAATLQTQVRSLPSQAATLPTTVRSQFDAYSAKAEELFTDLVTRGEKLVGAVRRQPSTQVAETAIDQTVDSAKVTAATAKKAAKATHQAGDDAASKI